MAPLSYFREDAEADLHIYGPLYLSKIPKIQSVRMVRGEIENWEMILSRIKFF